MRREILGLHSEAQACLKAYSWPGNVRELRNVIERGMILASGDTLCCEHLLPEIGAGPVETTPGPPPPPKAAPVALPAEGLRLEEVERDLVRRPWRPQKATRSGRRASSESAGTPCATG